MEEEDIMAKFAFIHENIEAKGYQQEFENHMKKHPDFNIETSTLPELIEVRRFLSNNFIDDKQFLRLPCRRKTTK